MFALGERTVACHRASNGQVSWKQAVPFRPVWVGVHADIVVIASQEGIEGRHSDNGALLWSWSGVRDPAGPVRDDTPPELGGFQLADGRLFFLQEERRLFAVEVVHGRTLWSMWAPGGRLYLPSPDGRFVLPYLAGSKAVVIQSTAGPVNVLDAQTGRVRCEVGARKASGPRLMALDEARILIVEDNASLMVVDVTTGKEVWNFTIEPSISLAGEPPEVLPTSAGILLLVRRNHGCFLECLDTQSGKRRWPEPIFLGIHPVNLELGTADEGVAYVTVDNLLCAYTLAEGKLIWQRPLLGHGSWRTIRVRDYLFTFPWGRDSTRLKCSWFLGSLDLCVTPPQGDYFSVMVSDLKTGMLLQRLNFPAVAPQASLETSSSSRVALLPELRSEKVLVSDTPAALHASGRGVVMIRDGQAWGLEAAR